MIAVLTCIAAGNGQHQAWAPPSGYPYSAALISTITNPPGHTELVVFPLRGKAFTIPIRSASVPRTFSPDGTALYGACTPSSEGSESAAGPIKIAWCKIDLKTGGTTTVPGTVQDFVPQSGDRTGSGDLTSLFGLTLPAGNPKVILLPAEAYPWMDLSLSPDNERAVATQNGRVELIDIIHGTIQPLGEEFFMGAWSPDGKWLAALEKGERGRTVLMDANNFARRRILGPSELIWSPDSRYLLGMKQHDQCGPYQGTVEMINVETGERGTIKSSKCQINQASIGWVSRDIS